MSGARLLPVSVPPAALGAPPPAAPPPPRRRPCAPARVTNEGREVRSSRVLRERGLDAQDEWIVLDPDLPIPRPEDGPLERRVSATFEEALESGEPDAEAMAYWFTEPPGGWPTERRRLRLARRLAADEVGAEPDDVRHAPEAAAAQGRAPLAGLAPGAELQGTVVALHLNHGVVVDVGAEADGLIPVFAAADQRAPDGAGGAAAAAPRPSEADVWARWAGALGDAAPRVGAAVRVRVVRTWADPLFRFPLQLELAGPGAAAGAAALPPPAAWAPPLDLRSPAARGVGPEELAARAGRDWAPARAVIGLRDPGPRRRGGEAEAAGEAGDEPPHVHAPDWTADEWDAVDRLADELALD